MTKPHNNKLMEHLPTSLPDRCKEWLWIVYPVIQYLLLGAVLFNACTGKSPSLEPADRVVPRNYFLQDTVVAVEHQLPEPFSNNVTLTALHYYNDSVCRAFVVLKPEFIRDTAMLRKAICQLKMSHPFKSKANVSFFTDKKYAQYKEVLFLEPNHPLPMSAYQNWLDHYYLAEYALDTRELVTYPASGIAGRWRVYSINPCH